MRADALPHTLSGFGLLSLPPFCNNQESAPTAFIRWQSSHCQHLKGNNLKELPKCTGRVCPMPRYRLNRQITAK